MDFDFGGQNPKTVFGIIFVVSIILFALSWDTVEPTEYGINCNTLTKKCDASHIYDGGRYFIWLFHYFITFPSNLQTIEFSSKIGANCITI